MYLVLLEFNNYQTSTRTIKLPQSDPPASICHSAPNHDTGNALQHRESKLSKIGANSLGPCARREPFRGWASDIFLY